MVTIADKDRVIGASFYNSKQWRDTRKSYISKVHGLCERCLAKGKHITGDVVHHKEYITDVNINDPWITLSHDNLECLCHRCHNNLHKSGSVTREGLAFDEYGDLVEI